VQGLGRLENNEMDIMPDVSYTEERSKLYDFSNEIVLASWSRVYAREGADIQSILDLEGKNIAVLRGSVNVEGPDGIKVLVAGFGINCTFTELDSYTKVFELVESKKADAGVTNKDFGNRYETDFDVQRTAIMFQPSHIQFAFPKKPSLTPYLIERIDYHMKELKKDRDSIYYRLLEKWLVVKPEEKPVIAGWVKWALAGIGGLALLLGGGSFILRSQVRSKTEDLGQEVTERVRAEKKLERMLEGVIQALGRTTEMRDPYTAGHQQRVTELACAVAEQMKVSPEQIEAIRIASLMHDIGKISVPADILSKPSRLTDIEFGLIKAHPQTAYDILKEIDFPWPVADIVLQHHERMDGSGYPQGLKGDEILLEARIIAVADVVEAMASHRPYRPALGIDEALGEIRKNKGRLYGPQAVEACLRLFDEGLEFEVSATT